LARGCIGCVSVPVQLAAVVPRLLRPAAPRSARDSPPSASVRDRCRRSAWCRRAGISPRRACRTPGIWPGCARRAMARVDQAVSSRIKIAPCRAPVNKNKSTRSDQSPPDNFRAAPRCNRCDRA